MFSRIHRRAGETAEREARGTECSRNPFFILTRGDANAAFAFLRQAHRRFVRGACARQTHTHREFMRRVEVRPDFQTFASRSYCAYPKPCDCSFVLVK